MFDTKLLKRNPLGNVIIKSRKGIAQKRVKI